LLLLLVTELDQLLEQELCLEPLSVGVLSCCHLLLELGSWVLVLLPAHILLSSKLLHELHLVDVLLIGDLRLLLGLLHAWVDLLLRHLLVHLGLLLLLLLGQELLVVHALTFHVVGLLLGLGAGLLDAAHVLGWLLSLKVLHHLLLLIVLHLVSRLARLRLLLRLLGHTSVVPLKNGASGGLGRLLLLDELLDLAVLVHLVWVALLLLSQLEALVVDSLEPWLSLSLVHLRWHSLPSWLSHLVHLELHVLGLRVGAGCLLLHQELLELRVHHLLLAHVLGVVSDLL